jgi:hypothetical protein
VREEEDGYHQPKQDDDRMHEPSRNVAADDEPPSTGVEWCGMERGEVSSLRRRRPYSPRDISFTSMNPSRRGVQLTPSARP